MSNLSVKQLFAGRLNAGRLIRKIDGDPEKIARGYSLGIFIGLMPLVGVKAIIAVAIASVLKWNKLAAGIGVFNINPITAPFFFGLNYLVGKQITGCNLAFEFSTEFSFRFFNELLRNGTEILFTLTIGGVVMGIPFAFFAYHITYFVLNKYRNT